MDPKNIKKEYTNGEVTVVWQSGLCVHSGVYVKNLPAEFKPKESPWIKIGESSIAEIQDTVKKCPSGALSLKN